MNNELRKKIFDGISISVLLVFLFLVFVPVILMLTFSLRSYNSILANFWGMPELAMLSNYSEAFGKIWLNLINSVIVSSVTAVCAVMLSAMNGYVYGALEFAGKKFLMSMLFALMMVPSILALTTTFMLIKDLNLRDTWFSLWLPWIAGGQIMGTVIMMTFIKNQAKELFESARLDGANEFSCFLSISLPLCKPIIAALIISNLMSSYNEFIWPLLVIDTPSKQVVMVELARLHDATTNKLFSVQIAGFVIASIPLLVLFLFGMKQFVEGISSGALKA